MTKATIARLQARATRAGITMDGALYVDAATFASDGCRTHEEAVLTRGPGYGVYERLGATRAAAEAAIDRLATAMDDGA